MQTKEIISSIFVHGAQDSSSFILLHEHSKVFKIIYTNCPWKRLSGKVTVRETSCTRNNRRVRARRRPGNVLSGKRLSGKVILPETSVTRCWRPRKKLITSTVTDWEPAC